MRFSAAIHQIAQRESEPAPPLDASLPVFDGPVPMLAQQHLPPPPPDLDQRVRLSGEW